MGGLEKKDSDKDCRAIKKGFLEKFKSGDYKVFLELVKKYGDELVLCFRGNNAGSEAVCIYYNNHLVYKIENNGNITINFNHARYSPEYRDFWKKINIEYGFDPDTEVSPRIKVSSTAHASGIRYYTELGYYTSSFNKRIAENVENIYYNCLRPMLIDSFDSFKTTDQFRATANRYAKYRSKITQTGSKSKWLEKIRQQQLFYAMKFTQNGYFFFDMEFSQKSMEDTEMCKKAIRNQPDMLAIRFENGCPKAYVLVEVKSTKEACGGASGIEKHLMAMEQYRKGCNMPARYREAALIISHYKELGLYPSLGDIAEKDYENLEKVEILFIFTDAAVSVLEELGNDTEEFEKLKAEYNVNEHVDNDIHLPGCKGLEIVEFIKK